MALPYQHFLFYFAWPYSPHGRRYKTLILLVLMKRCHPWLARFPNSEYNFRLDELMNTSLLLARMLSIIHIFTT